MPVSTQASSRDPDRDDWNSHWRVFSAASAGSPATEYRIRLVQRRLNSTLSQPDPRFLDIGSGPGDLAAAIEQRFPRAKIRGLELSSEGVQLARRRVPSAEFLEADLTKPLEPPRGWTRWATAAACSEVLEHLDDPEIFLKGSLRFLAPGCRVVITVPAGPMSAFDHHIGHRRHFTRNDLRHTLTESGLRVQRIDATGFPFFNLYRLSVIARGERLVADVNIQAGCTSRIIGASSRLFRPLFRCNVPRSPWGWQLVAVATVDASL